MHSHVRVDVARVWEVDPGAEGAVGSNQLCLVQVDVYAAKIGTLQHIWGVSYSIMRPKGDGGRSPAPRLRVVQPRCPANS